MVNKKIRLLIVLPVVLLGGVGCVATTINEQSNEVNKGYVKHEISFDEFIKENPPYEKAPTNGVQIFKGTVIENIIRIAKEELGVPQNHIKFSNMPPCQLLEELTYTIPESEFKDKSKLERLGLYLSFYEISLKYHPLTNSILVKYVGPDVTHKCQNRNKK